VGNELRELSVSRPSGKFIKFSKKSVPRSPLDRMANVEEPLQMKEIRADWEEGI
jgi:hypothetical protein